MSYMEDLQKGGKWYLSHEILYLEPEDISSGSKVLVWENLILIRADSPEEAYQKAIQHGMDSENEVRVGEQKRHFKFKGLKDLVLIYDELDDGAEIEWHEMSLGKEELEKLPKPKQDMHAFKPAETGNEFD